MIQVRRARKKEWSGRTQAEFCAELAMTGNVTMSVAAVGMSVGGAYNRRASDPAFAASWQAALVQGYERLEELLLATALASIGGGAVGLAEPTDEVGDANGNRKGGGDRLGRGQGQGKGNDKGKDDPGVPGDKDVEPAARFDGVGATGSGVTGIAAGVPSGAGQAVPGAGLVQLSSVTAIQFALAMLNQHRADQLRGRKKNQRHRATSAETDAALAKLLDSLARRKARTA